MFSEMLQIMSPMGATDYDYTVTYAADEMLYYVQIFRMGEQILPDGMIFPDESSAHNFAIGYVYGKENWYDRNPLQI